MREVLLVVHILAAGSWLGANVAQAVATPQLRDLGGAVAAGWMRQISRMGRILYTPAAVVLLLTGFWLVLDSDVYDFENLFVAIGIGAVVVGAVLGMRVFGPRADEAAAAFEAGDNPRGVAVVQRTMPFSALDTGILILTIIAMVNRWGA